MQSLEMVGTSPEPVLVRFEVQMGARRIACSVSDEALEAASGLVAPSTVALRRRSFDRFRMLIDAAAKFKIGALPTIAAGPVVIGVSDLRRVPLPKGVPAFGTTSRLMEKTG